MSNKKNKELANKLDSHNPNINIDDVRSKVNQEGKDNKITDISQLYVEEKSFDFMSKVPKPWGSTVDGNNLLDEIKALLKVHVHCQEDYYNTITLWIVFTWFIDVVNFSPILNIKSPQKRCGKSTLLEFLEKLTYKSLLINNMSPAAFFRIFDAYKPTMLIDEADTYLNNNDKDFFRSIINAGHKRGNCFIYRADTSGNKSLVPIRFNVWGAKAIAGIGNLAPTIVDRSITIKLERKPVTTNIKKVIHTEEEVFNTIKAKINRFVLDNYSIVKASKPSMPEFLNDRVRDNWEPLFAIADVAGGHWSEIIRKTAINLSKNQIEEDDDIEIILLKTIKDYFESKKTTKVHSCQLISFILEDETSILSTYNHHRPITPVQIARILKVFGIVPKNTRIGNENRKGYEYDFFVNAFNAYLPISDDKTP